jgi:hypothetical protein
MRARLEAEQLGSDISIQLRQIFERTEQNITHPANELPTDAVYESIVRRGSKSLGAHLTDCYHTIDGQMEQAHEYVRSIKSCYELMTELQPVVSQAMESAANLPNPNHYGALGMVSELGSAVRRVMYDAMSIRFFTEQLDDAMREMHKIQLNLVDIEDSRQAAARRSSEVMDKLSHLRRMELET